MDTPATGVPSAARHPPGAGLDTARSLAHGIAACCCAGRGPWFRHKAVLCSPRWILPRSPCLYAFRGYFPVIAKQFPIKRKKFPGYLHDSFGQLIDIHTTIRKLGGKFAVISRIHGNWPTRSAEECVAHCGNVASSEGGFRFTHPPTALAFSGGRQWRNSARAIMPTR